MIVLPLQKILAQIVKQEIDRESNWL